jgi:iron complex outermembrane receptor protein
MSGRYQIAPWIAAIAEFTYTKRDVPAYQNPLTIYLGEYGSYGAVVPANNPFNPFGVPVGIDYQFRDTGIFTTYMQKSYRGVFGLSGKAGHFEWDVSKTQTRDRSGTTGPASLNLDAVAAALNSTDPTTALNPFVGDGTAPATDDVMLSLYNNLDQRNESRTDVLTGYIRGPLMRFPAGDVLGLIGAEQQRQEITVDSDDTGLLVQYIEGVIKSRALFAELRLPILSPRAGGVNERLALSGAFRSESSDRTSERTRSETIGLEFRPTESLLLRATYSTAFRPLLAYNAVQTPYERRQFVRDPLHNPTQRVPVDTYLFGGVPEGLRPETSSTTTIGFLYRPSPGWSLSLTKWDIEFRDRIATISTQTIINNEDRFPGRVRRNSTTGLLEFVDGRPVNVARNDTAGVDIGAEANWTTQVGDFYAGLTATYTSKFQQQLTDTSPTTENVSFYNPEGWAPRWKIVPRIEWLPNEWLSTFVVGRYVNKYLDSTPLSSGPNAGEYKALGEFWIVDLNANISLRRFVSERNMLADSKISLGATNLFNRLPEFCAGCSGNSYDASQYDILGRNVYAELRLSF